MGAGKGHASVLRAMEMKHWLPEAEAELSRAIA
jgi:hypothetical protein